jgi:hypothetical protein
VNAWIKQVPKQSIYINKFIKWKDLWNWEPFQNCLFFNTTCIDVTNYEINNDHCFGIFNILHLRYSYMFTWDQNIVKHFWFIIHVYMRVGGKILKPVWHSEIVLCWDCFAHAQCQHVPVCVLRAFFLKILRMQVDFYLSRLLENNLTKTTFGKGIYCHKFGYSMIIQPSFLLVYLQSWPWNHVHDCTCLQTTIVYLSVSIVMVRFYSSNLLINAFSGFTYYWLCLVNVILTSTFLWKKLFCNMYAVGQHSAIKCL